MDNCIGWLLFLESKISKKCNFDDIQLLVLAHDCSAGKWPSIAWIKVLTGDWNLYSRTVSTREQMAHSEHVVRSEDELGSKWDRCIADSMIKFGKSDY